jgi:hypothetical protein
MASHRTEFYKKFYSVFEDQYAAMEALLNGKELFSFQVITFHFMRLLLDPDFFVN